MPRIGLVGVGFIGKLFVDSLAEAQESFVAYDIDESKVEYARERGGEAADDPAEVARRADTVVLSLPGAPEVEAVMESADGILDELEAGDALVDTTTTGPETALAYEAKCEERGVTYLTAPLTRGAADPGIHMMVGGTEENYRTGREVLDTLSAAHTRIGDPGDAQRFKLMIQLRYAGREAVDAEVVAFGAALGVGPERMNDFLGLGVDERYFGDDFSQDIEGMGGLRIWHKDIGYALDVASEENVATPLTDVVYEAYKHTMRGIEDDEGHAAAIVRHWRRLNGGT
jgi:3-hydroxyisobutyrate dehydrogenase-like beta-hydroxyacid dehydrogenase